MYGHSRFRYFSLRFLGIGIIPVATIFRRDLLEFALVTAVFSIVAAFFWFTTAPPDWLAIELTDTHVSGPGRGGKDREAIELEVIDRSISRKRTLIDKILGRSWIRSADGRRIRVDAWLLGRAKRCELMTELGM